MSRDRKSFLYIDALSTILLQALSFFDRIIDHKKITFSNFYSPLWGKRYWFDIFHLGSNVKLTKKHGDKWYKVIDHNIDTNDCCSDLDENELTDEEDLNNNNVNNQSLLSNYKSNETPSDAHSNCVRDFFDCLRFRRNYKRNRKKCGKGQSLLQIYE